MYYASDQILNDIRYDLHKIINDLQRISIGVRYDFKGIKSEKCSDAIDGVVSNYQHALQNLENIDTKSFSEEFIKLHKELFE